MDANQIHALIADAADAIVADQFTETKVQARAEAWQKQAPNASLAEQTIYMLAENRAYTEQLLAKVLLRLNAAQERH